MYCDEDFAYCMKNADCPNNGHGRFLFFKEGTDERLYIHLRRKRENTFYCLYQENKENKNEYRNTYDIIEIKTEIELQESDPNNVNGNFLHQFRVDHSLTPEGWEEQTHLHPHTEEIDFLNGIDREIASKHKTT